MMKKQITLGTHKNIGISLVEWLVVLTIVALVILIVLPALEGHGCGSPHLVDRSNLRQISLGMLVYAQENEEVFPLHPKDAVKFVESDPAYIGDVYLSPYQDRDEVIDRGDGDGVAVRYGGYVFVNLGLNLDEIEKPAELILAYTAKVTPEQTTRNVAFADVHVERWEEGKLRASLPEGVDVDALDGP
jgi:type II secretory pathway pseudopilin PulG